jgi:hypothetical protein
MIALLYFLLLNTLHPNACQNTPAGLRPVNPVPQHTEDETHSVAYAESNNYKKERGANIECPNNIHRFYKVQPEYEINQRLRPSNRHQERPEKVPPAQKRPKH